MLDLKADLDRYKLRCPQGSFMRAMLENDLLEAVSHADRTSSAQLADFVRFTYNYLPGFMWGTPKRVADWLAGRVDENGDPVE